MPNVQPALPDYKHEPLEYLRLKLRNERTIYQTFAGHLEKASTYDLWKRAEIHITLITSELQRRRFAEMTFGEYRYAAE